MADCKYPLHLAAESGNYNQVCSFLKAQVNIDETDLEGNTPLSRAVQFGQTAIVKLLLEKGANMRALYRCKTDCKMYYDENCPCKHIASKYGHLEMLKLLMEIATFSYINQLLHIAVGNDQIEAVKVLLKAGANINKENCAGNTPLHLAVLGNQVELLKLLLAAGASVLKKNDEKLTPLYLAAELDHVEIVEILLKNEPPLGKLTGRVLGYSFLHKIAQSGRTKVIQYFLNNGATVDVETSKGLNLLHVASGFGHKNLIQFLVDKGLDVNRKTFSKGNTPLHYAVGFYGPNVVDLLIQNGADFEAKNKKNCTPLDVIIKNIIHLSEYDQKFVRESAKVFIKYIMLRNKFTDAHFLDDYLFLEELLDYKTECVKDIEKMDLCMIGNTRISWYKFLRDTFNENKLVTYLYNENIRGELENPENSLGQFLVYSDLATMIKKRVERGAKRQCLLKEADLVMSNITSHLPEECRTEILCYLNETDLNIFIKSKNVK